MINIIKHLQLKELFPVSRETGGIVYGFAGQVTRIRCHEVGVLAGQLRAVAHQWYCVMTTFINQFRQGNLPIRLGAFAPF